MGYRNPSFDEFDDPARSFEWDADNQRWLYRRGGREAPIIVTDEEKERCEAIQRRGYLLLVLIYIAVCLVSLRWLDEAFANSAWAEALELPAIFALALVFLGLGTTLLELIATRRYSKRRPVGPARTRLRVWRMRAEQQSWASLAWPWPFVAIFVWAHASPAEPKDWVALAFAGLFSGYVLFQAILKRQSARL